MTKPTFLDNILNRPAQSYAEPSSSSSTTGKKRSKARAMSAGAYPSDLPNARKGPTSLLSGSMFQGQSLTQTYNPDYSTHPPTRRAASISGWSTASSIFGRKKKKDRNSVIDMFSDAGSTVAGSAYGGGDGYGSRKTKWWESGSKFRRGEGRKTGAPSIADSAMTEPPDRSYNDRSTKRFTTASSVAGAPPSHRHSHYDSTSGSQSLPRRTAMSDYGGPAASSSSHRRTRSSVKDSSSSAMPPMPAYDPSTLKALNEKSRALGPVVAPLGQQPKGLVQNSTREGQNASASTTSFQGALASSEKDQPRRRASSALVHGNSNGNVGSTGRAHKKTGSTDWHDFVAQMNNKDISKTWAAQDAANAAVKRNTTAHRVAKELQADAQAAASAAMQNRQHAIAPTSLAQAAEQIIGQTLPMGSFDGPGGAYSGEQAYLRQQGITILPPGIEPGSLIVTEAQLHSLSRPISPVPSFSPTARPTSPMRPMSPGIGSPYDGRDTPATVASVASDEYATASEASDTEDPARTQAVDGESSSEEEEESSDEDSPLALDPLAEVDEDNSSNGHSSVRQATYRNKEMRARPNRAGYSGLAPGLHPSSAVLAPVATVASAVGPKFANILTKSTTWDAPAPPAPVPVPVPALALASTDKGKGKARAIDEHDDHAQATPQRVKSGKRGAVPIVNPNLPSPQANRPVPAPPPPRRPSDDLQVPSIEVSSPASSRDAALRANSGVDSIPPTPPAKEVSMFPSTGVDGAEEDSDDSESADDEEDETEGGSDDDAQSDDSDETIDDNSKAAQPDAASALIRARQSLQTGNGAPSVRRNNTVSFGAASDDERESVRSTSRQSVKPPTIQRRLSDLSLGNSFRMSMILRGDQTPGSRSQRAASSLRIPIGANDSDSDGEANVSSDDDGDEDLKRRAQAEQDRLRNMKVGEDFFGPDLNSLLDKLNNTDWDSAVASNAIDKYDLDTKSTEPERVLVGKTADERAALDAQDRINGVRRAQLERRESDALASDAASVVPSVAALWLMNQEEDSAVEPERIIPASSVTATPTKAASKSRYGSLFASPHDKVENEDTASSSPRKASILDRAPFQRKRRPGAVKEAAEAAAAASSSFNRGHVRSSSAASGSSAGANQAEDDALKATLAGTALFYGTTANKTLKVEETPVAEDKSTAVPEAAAAAAAADVKEVPESSASKTEFVTPSSSFGTVKSDEVLANNVLTSSDSAPSALGKLSTGSSSVSDTSDVKKTASSSVAVPVASSKSGTSKPLTSAMKKPQAARPLSLADSLMSFSSIKKSSSLDTPKKKVTTIASSSASRKESDEDDSSAGEEDQASVKSDRRKVATATAAPAAAPPSAWAGRQGKVAKSERKAERSAKAKQAAEAAAEAKAVAEAQAAAEKAQAAAIKAKNKEEKKKKKSASKGKEVTPATTIEPASTASQEIQVSVEVPAPPGGQEHTVTVTVAPKPQPAKAAAPTLQALEGSLQPVPETASPAVVPASVASSSTGDAPGTLNPPLSDMWSDQSAVRAGELAAEGSQQDTTEFAQNVDKKLPLPPAPEFNESSQVPIEDRTPLARPMAPSAIGVNLVPPTPPAQDMGASPLFGNYKQAMPTVEDAAEGNGAYAPAMQRSSSSRSSGRTHISVGLPAGLVAQTVAKSGEKKMRSAKIPGLDALDMSSGPKHPNFPQSLVPLPPTVGDGVYLEPGLSSLTLPNVSDARSATGSDSPNTASPAASQSGRSATSSAVSRSSRTSSALRFQLAMNQSPARGSPSFSERGPHMAAIDEWESSASPYGNGLPGPLSAYPPLPAAALTRSSASLSQGQSPMVVRQAPLGAPANHFLESGSPGRRLSFDAGPLANPPTEGGSVIGSSYALSVAPSATSLPFPSANPSVYRPSKDPSKLSNKIDDALYGRSTMQTVNIISGSFRTKSSRKAASSSGHGLARDDASIRSSIEIPAHLRDEIGQSTMALSAHTPPPRKVGSSQVLVQVIAVAIDEMDRLIVQDRIRGGKGFGFVPGRSFCGRIMECGWDVKHLKKGTIIFGMQDGSKCGALAEFMTIDAAYVCKAPEDCLTTEQISALPAAGLLSHEIVTTYCSQLERGSRVLILNAHDGIGLLVMQQSVELGLIIVAQCPTAVSDGVAVCQANGAQEVVVGEPLWAINSLHESSFDLVVDTVGGRRIYDASRRVLATKGHFATCFGDEHGSASPNLKSHMRSLRRAFFKKDKKNIGYEWIGNLTAEDCREALESVKQAAERGDICPRLSSILPFEDAVRAFDPVLRGADQEPGAVVVRVS